jgi:hypothetical protein
MTDPRYTSTRRSHDISSGVDVNLIYAVVHHNDEYFSDTMYDSAPTLDELGVDLVADAYDDEEYGDDVMPPKLVHKPLATEFGDDAEPVMAVGIFGDLPSNPGLQPPVLDRPGPGGL